MIDTAAVAAGQRWQYRVADDYEASRLVVGAILTFADGGRIMCCSVEAAPRLEPDGAVEVVGIPFLPLSEAAFAASAVALDGEAEPHAGFIAALETWHADERGLSVFTVPFDGFLDRLVARQMADIMSRDAA